MSDIFGQIKIADDLDQAVISTLSAWFPTYIRELEIQANIPNGSIQQPKSFLTADKVDRSSADQLPSIVVVSPGLSGKKPMQEGDGTFRVFFSVGVGIFVSANNRANTMRLVRIFTAIVRTIMLQKQDLNGYAAGTTWLDESYDDDFNFTDKQTISQGQVVFEITVDSVVSRFGGPAVYGQTDPAPDPVTQPGSDWPLATSVTATVEVEDEE